MKYIKLAKWTRAVWVMVIGLMALGAGVRTMRAGLSCPDWPLCYGKIIPDFHVGVWFEFVHRAYAGLVGLIFFAIFIYICKEVFAKRMSDGIFALALGGLIALLLQILAGAGTVLLLVKAPVVTTHLLLATLFFLFVFLLDHSIRHLGSSPVESRAAVSPLIRWGLRLTPLVIFFQIGLGGLVASTYAGYVCIDWPLCNGQWVPTWEGPIGLQVMHRFVAYGILVLVLALRILMARAKVPAPLLRQQKFNLMFVVMQIAVGILNLKLLIPPHVTVLHQVLAVLLLAGQVRAQLLLGKSACDSGAARLKASSDISASSILTSR